MKKYWQFNKCKKLFSTWMLNFFIDILSILHSFRHTCRVEPFDYHLFSLYHLIIPINNPSRIYGFQIRWFGWYFNISRIFTILKLRKYLISKPVIILILNEWFHRLIYWQIQWLELFSTQLLQCILAQCIIVFKDVHNYQSMLL